MSERQKKITLFKTLGTNLIARGQWFLAKAFGIKVAKVIEKEELRSFILELDLPRPVLHDKKYHLIGWETWQGIIKYDWTDRKKYIKDVHDCDNFSNSFSGHAAEIFNLNSAGRFSVQVLSLTGKHIGFHRANIIVAVEDSSLVAYAYEPMNDKYTKIVKGRPVQIKSWIYKPNYISFN